MKIGWSLIGLLLIFSVDAQDESFNFSLLRQNDNLTGFENEEDKSFYSSLKYTELFRNGSVSFGGSYRGQYEFFKNEEFNFSPNRENGWYLQRILLHTDVSINKNLSVFGEVGSSIISGKEELAPVDRDELYINQLFAQYLRKNLTIKLGRENLKLGSNRLLDPREGPNVRRSFDQLSMKWSDEKRSYLLFGGSPVVPEQGVFDNNTFQNEELLWGFYVNRLMSGSFNLDAYYLGSHYDTLTYALGSEEEWRHSFGLRTWRSSGKWQYDNEAVLQLGSFGSQDIFAWTISFNIKNQLNTKNQVGIKTELISGTTSENTLGTFNPLYPRGAYFGRVARFGPANLIDIHPYWTFRSGKFMMEIDYDVFWRFSKDDAVYGPALNLVLEGESNSRFIAQQIGTIFNYEFSPFAMMELETNYIFPGDYINDLLPSSDNLLHIVFTTEIRF